jgi:hypothetical protein
MHTHGGWGIEGTGERKEGRGGGGMSKLDAKKGSKNRTPPLDSPASLLGSRLLSSLL